MDFFVSLHSDLYTLKTHIMIIVKKIDLSDGKYDGVWGGYSLNIDGEKYRTEMGIKTIDLKVKIIVKDGIAYREQEEKVKPQEKIKPQKTIKPTIYFYILFVAYICGLFIPFVDWIKHPELSQMQIFIKWWWLWAIMILSGIGIKTK